MEKIKVFTDTKEYYLRSAQYRVCKEKLQEICYSMAKCKIEPTTENLKMLLDGGSIIDHITKEQLKGAENLPKALQDIVLSDVEKKVEPIINQVKSLNSWNQTLSYGSIDLDLYSVDQNGFVQIDPKYLDLLEQSYCVFIDTPTRSALYDKCQAIIKGINDLNQELQESYRSLTPAEKAVRFDIRPGSIDLAGNKSLISINPDGTAELNGFYFSMIK